MNIKEGEVPSAASKEKNKSGPFLNIPSKV